MTGARGRHDPAASAHPATGAATVAAPSTPSGPRRVPWLDGVRAAAALYVVLHHLWISTWPHYPDNAGPAWLGWLAPGQLGVVVFIVVSGYSLTLAPTRHDLRLPGGPSEFARRRFWRIVPPYWAALVLCTLLVTVQNGWVDLRSFVVHAVLLQDLVANTPPNGTFWSIAVEAQIYLFFPLMLILARRRGPTTTTALVGILVIVAHGLATLAPSVFGKLDHVTPQLAACFAFGVWAAALAPRIAEARLAVLRRVCWLLLPVVVAGAWLLGPRRIVEGFFWVDLVVGAYAALAFLAVGAGAGRLPRALAGRTPVAVGRFSYSIYLVHAPVVALVSSLVVRHLTAEPLQRFALMLTLALPAALAASWLFFRVFEEPFLQVRSTAALGALLRRRLSFLGRPATADGTVRAVRPAPADRSAAEGVEQA